MYVPNSTWDRICHTILENWNKKKENTMYQKETKIKIKRHFKMPFFTKKKTKMTKKKTKENKQKRK